MGKKFCLWHGQNKIFGKHFLSEKITSRQSEEKYLTSKKKLAPHPLRVKWKVPYIKYLPHLKH